LSLKESIGKAIEDLLAKHPGIEKAITGEISAWVAKQPGADNIEVPLRCPACSYEWTSKFDLTKTNLVEAIKTAIRCPICGSESPKIRR